MHYSDKPWLKHYDPHVPYTLDYPDHPLHAFLEKVAPDLPAVITTAALPLFGRKDATLTYGELNELADALGSALVAMGLKKGDRVALVLPNCAAFPIAFYGTLKAGGVVTAVNPTYPPLRIKQQLKDSEAKFVIVLSAFYESVKSIQAETQVRHVIVTNIKEYLPPLAQRLFTLFRERKDGHRIEKRPEDHWLQDELARHLGKKPEAEVSADDICLFQFTGGTTGVPKAAVCTHRALVANTMQCRVWVTPEQVNREHAFLAALPLFHVYGLITVLSFGVFFGAPLVMVPDPRDIREILQCIDHYSCDAFMGVPAFYNAINNHPSAARYDLSTIETCISGAAPLPTETKAHFESLSGGRLLEGYGMSEMPSVTHINPVLGENRAGSIGLPVPDVECRIISLEDEETDMPVGAAGELVVSGPHMMQRYYNKPGETAYAIREDAAGKRWLYTGDIARMDEDGYFYVVDRKKDMTPIGGFSVFPSNVEKVIAAMPEVEDVCVAGIPHPNPAKVGQEALKAWVVLKSGQYLSESDIIARAKTQLAPYEIPYRYAFVDALPKSVVGKTLRRELMRREIEARAADRPDVEAVFFDIDGTLVEGNTWRGFMTYPRMPRRRIGYFGVTQIPNMLMFKLGLIDQVRFRDRWTRGLAWMLRGWSAEALDAFFTWLATERLLPSYRRDVIDFLEQHKAQGARVVLVSGILEGASARIAAHLGTEAGLGTTLDMQDGVCTGRVGESCQGPRKLEFIRAHLAQHAPGVELANAAAYADSFSDVSLLSAVGFPVAVYPDAKMRKKAMREGWRIYPE
ncbi:MAG: HAD-IB family hydrolase [Anaerolineae bacterium]|nr:HAD-IB family hydrolase [Anaerolineae bacterium]